MACRPAGPRDPAVTRCRALSGSHTKFIGWHPGRITRHSYKARGGGSPPAFARRPNTSVIVIDDTVYHSEATGADSGCMPDLVQVPFHRPGHPNPLHFAEVAGSSSHYLAGGIASPQTFQTSYPPQPTPNWLRLASNPRLNPNLTPKKPPLTQSRPAEPPQIRSLSAYIRLYLRSSAQNKPNPGPDPTQPTPKPRSQTPKISPPPTFQTTSPPPSRPKSLNFRPGTRQYPREAKQ